VEFAPIVLLGANPVIAIWKSVVSGLWGMFIHTNFDARMGRLQYLVNGPEMHRWHHADDPEAFESNYGTKFAFWDWVFGTAYFPDPHKQMAQSYGMGPGFEEYPLFGYFKQTLAIFRPFRKVDPSLLKSPHRLVAENDRGQS
jgi:sterol desaturase/sphingolipid hydroxylase (fatty acid hydroxylase superfamily)